MDDTNSVTLTYLSNPIYQTESQKDKRSDAEKLSLSNEEVRFYKKRVYALSRQLLRGNVGNEKVKKAHDQYVSVAIEYLKMVDTEELLQNEYKSIETDKCEEETDSNDFDITAANNVMFPSRKENSTLDSYVTTKKLYVKENPKPPQRKKLNLQADNLRLKGVKKKEKKKM